MKYKIILLAAAALSLAACAPTSTTAERADSAATAQLQAQAQATVGLPRITHFTQKRLATQIAEMLDQPNLSTWAYTQGIDGRLHCFGRGIGYGLPYGTQITNPEKQVYSTYDAPTIPQAEPNGLYLPDNAAASWYVMVGPKGQALPIYIESDLTVAPFPLTGPNVATRCPE